MIFISIRIHPVPEFILVTSILLLTRCLYCATRNCNVNLPYTVADPSQYCSVRRLVVEDYQGDWLCSPFGNRPIRDIGRQLVFVTLVDRCPFDRMLLIALSAVSLSIFSFPDLDRLANVVCLLVL